ncbi:MAG: cadherin domain-containing protein [Pirellulaceae bacterium]
MFTINVQDVNEAPSTVDLSNSVVDENQVIGTVVGALATTDPDVNDSFTYTLVAGDGDADNAQFQIIGNELKTAAEFDFESQSSYTIRVRTTDLQGLFFETQLGIVVGNINESPSSLTLSQNTIDENLPLGSVVGTFSTEDPDGDTEFEYSFIAGPGDLDNTAFQIVGNQIQSNESFDFESKQSYSVRVRVTDPGGIGFDAQFAIFVNDIQEFDSLDTNQDGFVSPIDVLLVINHLNAFQSGPTTPATIALDTSKDDFISPIDVLLVINYLNQSGEGESSLAQFLEPTEPPRMHAALVDAFFDSIDSKRKFWL